MILLDTSYLIALFDARDALHARAMAWSETVNEPLVVTEYVLWETVNAFLHPADRPKAHALLAQVRTGAGCELVRANEKLFEAGLALHQARPDKAWSLTDCISFIVMQERGIWEALAYDEDFAQAGFEALLRREPDVKEP